MSDFKVSDVLLSKGNARSIIDIDELSVEELDKIIKRACDIMENPKKYSRVCEGKKLATLFYEPSTRTRLSFEAAMMELGGNVLGFSSASSASVSKGESVSDTAKVISCYADIIAMRHPYEGAPLVAAESASIPLINAGDGGHAHPTQTLADLLTIYREHGRLNNMVIGLCGDLKYGRTVHSLIKAMIRYEGVSFVLISPRELSLPAYIKTEVLEKNNVTFAETTSLEEAIPKLDILYMTRIQRERFDDLEEYERLKDSYVLTKSKLAAAKESMSVLHPLPRVNEISVDVDDDSRACYFKQALYGKFMRMSLILSLLEGSVGTIREKVIAQDKKKHKCRNPKCISQIEQELPQRFKIGTDACTRCAYCDNLIESN
ncbi:aspartate carbamoyltransferase [Eubacterium infirmum F0142]|nr:aspartate carbamoyltransferase [Eubacterium infirmum F0142]